MTASFFKELVRRATFLAIEAGGDAQVGAQHLAAALEELLTHSAPVLRAILGVESDEAETGPGMPGARPFPGAPAGPHNF